MTVESVQSDDGTRIACVRSGEGPPLVLVPGVTGDHTHFAFLAPLLEPYFSLWIVHRRGRGRSGDGRTYAIEREFEDVAAIVDAIDDPVDVFAHSFGATVMLGAMPRARNLRRVVLYEPGAGVGPESVGFTDELDALLARGEREALLLRFHQEVADPTPEDMDRYRTSPDFDRDLALIGTISRECRAEEEWAYSRRLARRPPRCCSSAVKARDAPTRPSHSPRPRCRTAGPPSSKATGTSPCGPSPNSSRDSSWNSSAARNTPYTPAGDRAP